MPVSVLRRIAAPKKTVAGAAMALAAAGTAFSSAPAHAAAPATAPAAVAPAAAGSPQAIAKKMIPDPAQYAAFSKIVSHESGWNPKATNASSGAYGLVQALPASKMSTAGSDWKTNPKTQIKWGLDYMNSRYGSPAEALSFWQSNGWY